MTSNEWLEKRFVKSDFEYLKKCGFEVEIVDSKDEKSEYSLKIFDGEWTEILANPYTIEQAVRVIKMYLTVSEKEKNDC